MTDKGVDWGVEILGVPKEEGVLMCTKVRHQHRHHSVTERRKPVLFLKYKPHADFAHLALQTGTLVEREEESVSTTFWVRTLWNFTVQSLLAVTRL